MHRIPRLPALAVVTVVILWAVDSFIDARVFGAGTFVESLLRPDAIELYMRSVAVLSILMMGVLGEFYVRRLRLANAVHHDVVTQYASILAATDDGALSTDADGLITAFNPGAERLFGYEASEIIGRPIDLLCPPDLREEQKATWAEVLKGRPPESLVTERLAKDGRRIPVDLSLNALQDERGKVRGATALIRDVSERQRVEKQSRKNEDHLRRLFRVAPVGFGVIRDRTLTEVNDRLCQMVGRSREELQGAPTSVLFPDAETYQHIADRDPLAPGDIATAQTRWVHADGHRVDVVLHWSVLDDDTPSRGLLFAAEDVTETLADRRKLEDQHLHLQQAQALAQTGSWTLELDTRRMTGSPEAQRIYGLTGEAWPLEAVQAVPLEEYRPTMDRALTALLMEGRPYDVEFSIRRASDGELRRVRSVATLERTKRRVIGVIMDVTEQREAEEELRNSEERFRSLIEQSSQGIYVIADDRWELVNPRFCEITGYTQVELQAGTLQLASMIAPESLPMVEERRQRRLRGETVPDLYEFTLRHRSGHPVHVQTSVTTIQYRGRNAILGFLQDVTAQKEMEARLDQALRMESVGRLSGGVAHDLNNLLSPILGYGGLLLEEMSEDDDQRVAVDAIVQAGSRARDLVKQLLAFSRQQPLKTVPLDANVVIQDLMKLLVRTLREDVHIEARLEPDLPLIDGDRVHLEQVVMNLAVNGQDAMAEGGVLTLETTLVDLDEAEADRYPGARPGQFVRISVTDTGEGMSPTVRGRIFEPFFTTKEQGKGTGLGLSTVYGVVRQHGGHVHVSSEPGRGSTFSCFFPAVVPDTIEGAAEERDDVTPEEGEGRETILVVEDEPLVRELVVTILSRRGYRTLSAPDGQTALTLLGTLSAPVDLVVTDVILPGLSGRDLSDALGAASPDTRVLFMSGYTGDVINERGILTEDNFIQKPFSNQALTAKVREVLDA